LNEIGGNLFTIHQYDLALRACELATQIALKNNPAQSYAVTESRSQAALIKASIGAERRDFIAIREAIDIYLQAIENHKTFDENEYPDNYEEIATLYSYTGMAYEDLDEIENARDMYQKGIEVYTQLSLLNSDDYISLGILYNNLGNTYSGSEALKYYLLAKDNHKKSGALTRHAAITLYHLADVYASNDSGVMNLELAARYAQKVLAFFQDEYSDDLYMIGEAKYMLGKVYSQFNDTTIVQNAYTLLKESEKIFVQFLPPEDHTIVKTIQLISEVAKKLKSASKH
jgi:tetratricopeptide (TPR) repeat protein